MQPQLLAESVEQVVPGRVRLPLPLPAHVVCVAAARRRGARPGASAARPRILSPSPGCAPWLQATWPSALSCWRPWRCASRGTATAARWRSSGAGSCTLVPSWWGRAGAVCVLLAGQPGSDSCRWRAGGTRRPPRPRPTAPPHCPPPDQALNIALNNISLLDISLTLNQIIRCAVGARRACA